MYLVFGIWMALLGALGASNLIIARKPDAKALIAKFAPFQGWIGAVSALWGAWGVIQCALNTRVLTAYPIWWITWLATSIVLLALGLLLGIGVFKTFIKNPQAHVRMDAAIARVAPWQGILGLFGIALGAWAVIAALLFLR
jgi:hypothetical protein